MLKNRVAWSIIPILLLAGLLRGMWLDSRCLFFDEIWHMELSTGRGSAHLRLPVDQLVTPQANPVMLENAPPWYAIWSHMDWVIHPPFYHFTLRIWRTIFGESGTIARAWSVVCSVLAILVLFDVVRRQFNTTTALWACAIMAVSGSQIYLAQDARGYPLLLVLGLIACWIITWIDRRGSSPLIASSLSLAALAMMLTHYFAAGAIAGMFIYALVRLQNSSRRQVLIALGVAVGLFTILWGPTLWMQTSYISDSADIFLKEWENHPTNFMARAAQEPVRLLFEPYNSTWIAGLLGISVVVIAILKLRRDPSLLFWCWWFAGVVGLVTILDLARGTLHMHYIRYTVLASPAVCIVLARASDHMQGILKHMVPAFAFLLCAITVPTGYAARELNPELRPMAQYLDSIAREGEPLLFISRDAAGRDGQTLYLDMSLYARLWPRSVICATKPFDAELLAQLPAGRDLLVISPVINVDMQQVISGCEVVERRSFAGTGECLKVRLPRAGATNPSI